jgi:hypothetical protein
MPDRQTKILRRTRKRAAPSAASALDDDSTSLVPFCDKASAGDANKPPKAKRQKLKLTLEEKKAKRAAQKALIALQTQRNTRKENLYVCSAEELDQIEKEDESHVEQLLEAAPMNFPIFVPSSDYEGQFDSEQSMRNLQLAVSAMDRRTCSPSMFHLLEKVGTFLIALEHKRAQRAMAMTMTAVTEHESEAMDFAVPTRALSKSALMEEDEDVVQSSGVVIVNS